MSSNECLIASEIKDFADISEIFTNDTTAKQILIEHFNDTEFEIKRLKKFINDYLLDDPLGKKKEEDYMKKLEGINSLLYDIIKINDPIQMTICVFNTAIIYKKRYKKCPRYINKFLDKQKEFEAFVMKYGTLVK